MPSCIMRYCKNTSKNASKALGITFHRFLRPNHPKREAWIRFVQDERREETWLPSEHSHICSAHFRVDDFDMTKTGRRFLKKNAVPYYPIETPGNASPCSLEEEYVSDSESIFDTPKEIQLKQDLCKVTASKQLLIKKIKKLKRQNSALNKKNEILKEIVKKYKDVFGIDGIMEKELLGNLKQFRV